MDNIPDQPLELNSKEALQAQMDTARRNISETVSNLKTEIGQALDWQTYVPPSPGYLPGKRRISRPCSRASHERGATFKSKGTPEAAAGINRAGAFPSLFSARSPGVADR